MSRFKQFYTEDL